MQIKRHPTIGLLLLITVFLYSFKAGEQTGTNAINDPPFISFPTPWADSVIQTLNDEEKIAQLFMVAAYSNRDKEHQKELKNLVEKYGIGGLIFFQGGPLRQAHMCNALQETSKVPLLIGMDAEWGLAMRLDSTVKYPWQMTLGAISDDDLIFEMGKQIGEQMNRLGVHINFAPVVDVNVNPENPVINARSFGEDRENVARKGIAYMQGMQQMRVLSNAKHFPGHGDTDKDSHKTLPTVEHRKERLDSIELYPFRRLMENGLSSIMVAHLYVPALDKEFNMPTTLSHKVVTGLLKDSMRFQGLIITDALNMKGVSDFYKPGEVDVKALLAGNDIMLFSEGVPKAIEEIKDAVKEGLISMEELEKRALKVLRAKEWAGLGKYQPTNTENLYQELNKNEYHLLVRELEKRSITVLQNKKEFLPLKSLDTLSIAAISFGNNGHVSFEHYLNLYADVKIFKLEMEPTPVEQKKILDEMEEYDLVIVGIHAQNTNPYSKFRVEGGSADFINILRLRKKVILTAFCNPYALRNISVLDHFESVIMAYQNTETTNEVVAQLIFGGVGADGRLPVTINNAFKSGSGIDLKERIRLNYVFPEEIGIDPEWLLEIDSIAMEGIEESAFPGCQILAAMDGQVFYHKTFGYHTYDSARLVKTSDIYDIASVTKVAATLLAIMELNGEGKINLDFALCDYLPDLVDSTVYANISLRQILAHQAGLKAWIPFYKKSLYKGKPRYDVYSLDSSSIYNQRVAENLFINKHYRDSIFKEIIQSPLNEPGEYRYSDLGYYFLQEIVERMNGEDLDTYVKRKYYRPLGMNRTTFKPRRTGMPMVEIIPTEKDETFRKQLIHGDVHDPGSAMMGGVGGHAGLFSNANDLAKLMQLYLNGGRYGGIQYLSDSIITEYTSCQYCESDNRRGAGFDKPMIGLEDGGPTCTCVSLMSFGHSGFTGTYVWADPETGIVYIFLSNRIYPTSDNPNLVKLGIRTRIQEVIHAAVNRRENVDLISDTIGH